MAGFRSPLFVLGLSAGSERAGFRSPLPIYGPSVPSGGEQAGFTSPLPLPGFGAGGQQQAGFLSPLPLPGFGAGEYIEPPPTLRTIKGSGIDERLHREDEEILAVIVAATLRRGYGGNFGA